MLVGSVDEGTLQSGPSSTVVSNLMLMSWTGDCDAQHRSAGTFPGLRLSGSREAKRRVAPKASLRFKRKTRELTGPSAGIRR